MIIVPILMVVTGFIGLATTFYFLGKMVAWREAQVEIGQLKAAFDLPIEDFYKREINDPTHNYDPDPH